MKLNFISSVDNSVPRSRLVRWLFKNNDSTDITVMKNSGLRFPELIMLALHGNNNFKVHVIKDKYVYKTARYKEIG